MAENKTPVTFKITEVLEQYGPDKGGVVRLEGKDGSLYGVSAGDIKNGFVPLKNTEPAAKRLDTLEAKKCEQRQFNRNNHALIPMEGRSDKGVSHVVRISDGEKERDVTIFLPKSANLTPEEPGKFTVEGWKLRNALADAMKGESVAMVNGNLMGGEKFLINDFYSFEKQEKAREEKGKEAESQAKENERPTKEAAKTYAKKKAKAQASRGQDEPGQDKSR